MSNARIWGSVKKLVHCEEYIPVVYIRISFSYLTKSKAKLKFDEKNILGSEKVLLNSAGGKTQKVILGLKILFPKDIWAAKIIMQEFWLDNQICW